MKALLLLLLAFSSTSCAFAESSTGLRLPTLSLFEQVIPAENTLTLVKSDRVNQFGNPIWVLTTPSGEAFDVVTGRSNTQDLDRDIAGLEAPLPVGTYAIGYSHSGPFVSSELGDSWFIDLHPTFMTGRTDLGIHVDPSFNQSELDDGTAGCVGLTSESDLAELIQIIRDQNITQLVVKT
jgi:hypothetical protein